MHAVGKGVTAGTLLFLALTLSGSTTRGPLAEADWSERGAAAFAYVTAQSQTQNTVPRGRGDHTVGATRLRDEPSSGSDGERHRVDRRVGGELRRHVERLHADRRGHRRRRGHRHQSRDPALGQPLDPGWRDHAHGDGARRGRARRGHHSPSHRPQRCVHHEPAGRRDRGGLVWSDIWVEGAAAGTRTFTLSIGGTTLATASASGNHVTLPWDSSRVPSGPQVIVATVRDAAGPVGTATRQSHCPQRPGARGVHHEPAGRRDREESCGRTSGSRGRRRGPGPSRCRSAAPRSPRRAPAATTSRCPGTHRAWRTASQTIVATVRDAAGHAGVGTRTVNIQNGLLAGAGTAPRSVIAPTR